MEVAEIVDSSPSKIDQEKFTENIIKINEQRDQGLRAKNPDRPKVSLRNIQGAEIPYIMFGGVEGSWSTLDRSYGGYIDPTRDVFVVIAEGFVEDNTRDINDILQSPFKIVASTQEVIGELPAQELEVQRSPRAIDLLNKAEDRAKSFREKDLITGRPLSRGILPTPQYSKA